MTPWASWSEWEEVYTALFALDDAARREHGVRALLPRRKEPLQNEHVRSMLAVDEGTTNKLAWTTIHKEYVETTAAPLLATLCEMDSRAQAVRLTRRLQQTKIS